MNNKRNNNHSSRKGKKYFNSKDNIKRAINSYVKTAGFYTQRNRKKQTINKYINELMEDDEKEKSGFYTVYDKRKKGHLKNQFSYEKYVNKKFLNEKNNINKFIDNNKNNLDLLSINSEFNNMNTKTLIKQMYNCQYKIKNFHFGKNNYTHKNSITKTHNIDLKNIIIKEIEKAKDNDIQFTFDEIINNAILKATLVKNTFIKNKKIREKIINKIQKQCDNYENIIKKSLNS